MPSTTKNILGAGLASMAFLGQASAHLIMASPAPFGGPALDNSPLSSDGSNFPCKFNGQASFWDRSNETPMAIGEQQSLSFTGSAVHGGGSCQLAVTSDLEPTASSTWQVILSIEGGCPSKTGAGPDTYPFTIPEGIAPGQYVFGWTWISKLAGQPEYYMNCAPITVTGGAAKREVEQPVSKRQSAFPNLFVANLASVNSCKVGPSVDPEYPEPGPNVERPDGAARAFTAPTGENCFPIGGTSSGGGAAAPPAESSPVAGGAPSTPVAGGAPSTPAAGGASTPAGGAVSTPVAGGASTPNPASPSQTGGGFQDSSVAPVVPSAPASTPAAGIPSAPVSSPAGGVSSPAVVPTPVVGGPSTMITSAVSVPAVGVSSAAPAPPVGTAPAGGNGGSTGGATGGLSGACTTEGTWNCIGGSSFQRCASGQWSAVQPMAAGTSCTPGQSASLWKGRLARRNRIFA